MKKLMILPMALLALTPWGYADYATGSLSTVDAGLTMDFVFAAEATGNTIDVTDPAYGATSDDDSDDDSTAIQAALNAADSGDKVYIPAGTYHLKSTINVPSNVTLSGAGLEQTHLLAEFSSARKMFTIDSGRSDIILEDFHISRNNSVELTMGIEISSSSASTNAREIIIRDLAIDSFSERGINIRSSHHVYVENCIISNATDLSGGGHGYGIAINDDSTNNVWINGCTLGPTLRHAVLLQYEAHHNLIENCYAFDSAYDAFDLHGEGEYSNELRYNVVTGVTYATYGAGFAMGNTSHDKTGANNWIHDNEIYDCTYGITIIYGSDSQVIERNYIHDTSGAALYIWDGGADDLKILNNIFYNFGGLAGLYYEEGGDNVASSVIDGNHITHGSTSYGIVLGSGISGLTITNNDLRYNGSPYREMDDSSARPDSSNYYLSEDLPPLVSAGADFSTDAGRQVTLDGRVVDEGLPYPDTAGVSVTWSVVDGSGVFFDDETALNPTVRFSFEGTYVLQLTANDGVNDPVSDTVTVTVEFNETIFGGEPSWLKEDTFLGTVADYYFIGADTGYLYKYEENEWYWVYSGSSEESVYLWSFAEESYIWVNANYYPNYWRFSDSSWHQFDDLIGILLF